MPDGIDSSPKGGAKSRSVFKLDETESKIAKGFPLGELASAARLRGSFPIKYEDFVYDRDCSHHHR